MRIPWTSSAVLIASLTLILLSSASRAQNASSAERQLFDAANHERRSQGIAALQWDEALAAAAHNHALEMAKRSTVSHQFPGEPSFPTRTRQAGAHYSSLAEDVDQGPNAGVIHQRLMASPLHRANILDRGMDSPGIGMAERDGQWYAVEDFSKAK